MKINDDNVIITNNDNNSNKNVLYVIVSCDTSLAFFSYPEFSLVLCVCECV